MAKAPAELEIPVIPPSTAVNEPDRHTPQGGSIREVIFGINDGLVTCIGFVTGATGVIHDAHTLILAGAVLVVAGSLSMAAGAYLSSKAQHQYYMSEVAREFREIKEVPEQERQEIRDICAEYGFTPDETEIMVQRITADPALWVRFMMQNELGINDTDSQTPIRDALVIGVAYIIGSIPPLVPYLLIGDLKKAMFVAIGVSLSFLFAVGAGKAGFTGGNRWRSGLEMLLIGSGVALISYFAGEWVSSLAGKMML